MSSSCKLFVAFLGSVLFLNFAAAQSATPQANVTLDAVTGSTAQRDGIEVQAGSASLRVTALRDDIIRVRVAPGSAFPEDSSWAVLPEARSKSIDVQPLQDAPSVAFRTAPLDA